MAVQPGGKVWVVRDDGMVQAKSVVIGKIAGDNTQIIAGLKGGESVVVV
jgi:predicted NUDIX family NTP pyrophosphohydrolase